jgi:hypothetical protein
MQTMSTGGISKPKALLTVRAFEAIDPSLGIEFLKAHPVTQFPEYWKPKREKFFFGLFSRPVRRRATKVVTTAYAEFIAAQLITETSAFGDFKYHHSGEGTGDENIADTGLGAPKENARDVGTQVQGTSTVKYKSVATTTYTGTWAITEHGLFNTAGAGGPPVTGGVLMDRSKFAAINVVATNQVEWTYEHTVAAGG